MKNKVKKKNKRNQKKHSKFISLKNKFKLMWRRKSYLGIAAMVSILIAVISVSTFAWFQSTDAKENKFKTDFKYEVELVDEFKTPEKLEFNKTYKKKVSVKNTGDIPAFARILVFPELTLGDEVLPIDDVVKIDYNISKNSNWIYGEDGYYYYTKVINPKSESEILFDEVSLSVLKEKEFNAQYRDAAFNIDVKLEAVDFRKDEYRFSWWKDRDKAPSEPKLKQVDDLLQKEKR